MTSTSTQQTPRGFTIVELLIVIVVIAILAAITVVAYNGIQQRAHNTATIAAAKQAINAINMYIADNGTYPESGNGSFCLTTNQTCIWSEPISNSSTALQANLSDYSNLPRSIAATSHTGYAGIIYHKNNTRRYNGRVQPVIVLYTLSGTDQQCQLPDITTSGGATMETSTNGRTANSLGATICVVSIEGPSA